MGRKVVIIGGGAAGLMAAVEAEKNNNCVTVIEHNSRPARKVMITGKGRCNVTNNTDENGILSAVTKNSKFLYSAIRTFNSKDTMNFFENNNVPLKTERGNRVFPKSNKAVDIVDALVSAALQSGAKIKNGHATEIICNNQKAVTGVKLQNGEVISCDSVILATGGVSYSATGSDGSGYSIAEKLGHTLITPKPSIVPLVARNGWVSELQGLSLKNISVTVTELKSKKSVYNDFGELIFTHYGLSGPVILSASAHMRNLPETEYEISIDLKPALSEEQLNLRILRDFEKYKNRDFINSLCDLLPKRMVSTVVKLSKIPPSVKVNQITKEQRLNLVKILKHLTVEIINFRPIEEAIVTSGGIKVSEINPKTMESKLVKNLYFAGEIIDIDAYTGGYNLQLAFSTGVVAGKNV